MALVAVLALPHLGGKDARKEELTTALRPHLEGAATPVTVLTSPGRCKSLANDLMPRLGLRPDDVSVTAVGEFGDDAEPDERWSAFQKAVFQFAITGDGTMVLLLNTRTARLAAAALVAGTTSSAEWAVVDAVNNSRPAASFILDVTATLAWPAATLAASQRAEMIWGGEQKL